jgi:transposase
MAKQKTHKTPAIETLNIGAAAVDIGSREHMAAVNPEVTDAPVRAFGTFTHDLHDLADWSKSHGVTSVAMESTGVYWIPAYEILEQHGFEVILSRAGTDLQWRIFVTKVSSMSKRTGGLMMFCTHSRCSLE